MIEIKNLSKLYGTKLALDYINLTFHPGTISGIVGENGAGKTTLFRCISQLEKYQGSIISPFDVLKNHIGLLTTHPYYLSHITGKEYLQLICNARKIRMEDIEDKNIFDLPLKEFASNYSTGMKKKLALTAILLQKNDIYILDEPYNGVDIQSNIIISEIIDKLKSLGKTILISSHIFSVLADKCDQIHVLHAGKYKKTVERDAYESLESEMKENILAKNISKFKLE